MVRRYVLLAAVLASPACFLGVPSLIEETEPERCEPGDTMVCYQGPEDTQDEGICHAGAGLCNEDGLVDVCEGQVLPRVEVCRSDDTLDEDCDGEVNDHCALWSASFGGNGPDRLVGLTTFGDSVVISGDYANDIDFGGEAFSHDTSSGGWVARFDEDGGHLWSVDIGGTSGERASSVASSADRVLVGGHFNGNLTIGADEQMSGSANRALFVAALMPDDGAEDWVVSFGDSGESSLLTIAVHDGSNVIGAGDIDGAITFDTLPTLTASGGGDALIFALDAMGTPLWAKSAGGAGDDFARGLAVIGDVVYVSGWAKEDLDLGCTDTVTTDGDGDGWVAALDATTGDCQWLMHLPAEGEARARALATDGERLFVGVDFEQTLTLPNGEVLTSAGDLDIAIFAMTLDREVIWSRQFGDDAKQDIFVATADGAGGVVIGGAATGTPDLGEGNIVSQDVGEDAYAIRLDALGQVLWARTFGGDGDDDTINAAFSP
ncbi:MAG TPA: hypothetical protein ENK57_04200, partial [Polyangiaceae bacterium]|nr:hypothetical protein [Polyangiaceae bacterium]